ncbi:MAG: hypothetical protein WA871_09900 [Candidatus Acidiferrales bacterium]
MIRSNILALLLVLTLAPVAHSATLAGRAAAGNSPAAQTTPVATMPAPHPKRMKFHGEVIDQTSTFITVRNLNPNHPNELRTYTFSPQLKPKMQRILNAGGFQHGDKVVVTTLTGSTVALNVHGRPSKPA